LLGRPHGTPFPTTYSKNLTRERTKKKFETLLLLTVAAAAAGGGGGFLLFPRPHMVRALSVDGRRLSVHLSKILSSNNINDYKLTINYDKTNGCCYSFLTSVFSHRHSVTHSRRDVMFGNRFIANGGKNENLSLIVPKLRKRVPRCPFFETQGRPGL